MQSPAYRRNLPCILALLPYSREVPMFFRMDQLLLSFSLGLDFVEGEIFGATTNHGKRVAVLTAAMGRLAGWNDDQVITAAACALLHDNALSEASIERVPGAKVTAAALAAHCTEGEKNAAHLPFPSEMKDIILYHHEYMDGSGPFGMNAENTPLGAQFIAIADNLDIRYKIQSQPASALSQLREEIKRKRGVYYTADAADALLEILDENLLISLTDERIGQSYAQAIPQWKVEIQTEAMMGIAEVAARIIDYKSKFTAKHSTQIANRAFWMCRFYGFDPQTCTKVYLAAALHDLGKLMTPTAILEKPGRLTDEEFEIIKQHVHWSYIMLKDVEGLAEICRWAVSHHRKLTGSGYPDLPAEYLELDFVSRLLTCIDIYQAVRETRPYHPGRSHSETMRILWDMANRGEIDKQITQDLDSEMARFPDGDGDVPNPAEQDAFI